MGAPSAEVWYTVGPASVDRALELLAAGATGARLTFSYGSPSIQLARATALRAASAQLGLPCCVIADLPGKKVRLGTFQHDQEITVSPGQMLRLVARAQTDPAESGEVAVPDSTFLTARRPGDVLLVGDGLMRLRVTESVESGVAVVVENGGKLQHRRGVTVGGGADPACFRDGDIELLGDIARTGAYDAVALSFVSTADDIHQARAAVDAAGTDGRRTRIFAKIETKTALTHLPEICAEADGVIAARGDLALCLPWVELPATVQAVADAARDAGVDWYLATQIAEGSGCNGFPTRAEICDLAHWRAAGCAGALLAYETAFGSDPVAAVRDTLAIVERWPSKIDRG